MSGVGRLFYLELQHLVNTLKYIPCNDFTHSLSHLPRLETKCFQSIHNAILYGKNMCKSLFPESVIYLAWQKTELRNLTGLFWIIWVGLRCNHTYTDKRKAKGDFRGEGDVKTEFGAMPSYSKGCQVATTNWKRQENGFSHTASKGSMTRWHFDCNSLKLILDFRTVRK